MYLYYILKVFKILNYNVINYGMFKIKKNVGIFEDYGVVKVMKNYINIDIYRFVDVCRCLEIFINKILMLSWEFVCFF